MLYPPDITHSYYNDCIPWAVLYSLYDDVVTDNLLQTRFKKEEERADNTALRGPRRRRGEAVLFRGPQQTGTLPRTHHHVCRHSREAEATSGEVRMNMSFLPGMYLFYFSTDT